MTPRNAAAWVAVFLGLVVLAWQLIDSGESDQPRPPIGGEIPTVAEGERTAGVLRVVDGDTILVREDSGRTARVRYIGVDTPESVKPGTPVECYGKEAAAFNRKLVEGREVTLVQDREPRDRYGRLLAYVYVNGDTLVNAELIKRGFARTIEIPPNTSKAERFAGLERVAIRTNRGLWRACDR